MASPSASRTEAAASVDAFVTAQYAAVGRGSSFKAWAEMNDADAPFISSSGFGADRDNTLARLDGNFGRVFQAGGAISMASAGPRRIGVAPAGDAAWLADDVDLRIAIPGAEPEVVQLRVSEVLMRRDGRWSIAASHWSLPQQEAEVVAAAAAGAAWPAAGDFEPREGPNASSLAPLLAAGAANASSDLIASDWTHAPWGGAERVRAGGTNHGGMIAAVSPLGEIGWIAGQLDLPASQGDAKARVPVRALAVYSRRDGGTWQLVQWHVSVARRPS